MATDCALLRGLMSINLTNPKYWRERAGYARKNAEQMADDESKRTMLGIAASYEKLAERGPRKCGSEWSLRLVDRLITTPTARR
jgi:hypothetical protein